MRETYSERDTGGRERYRERERERERERGGGEGHSDRQTDRCTNDICYAILSL